MTDTKQSRGFAGAVLKLLRAGDYELTVTGRTQVSPHYVRLSFAAGGLLEERSLHPTQWIRMWFSDGDKLHQRGYTLVNPDRAADTVDIEFLAENPGQWFFHCHNLFHAVTGMAREVVYLTPDP